MYSVAESEGRVADERLAIPTGRKKGSQVKEIWR